MSKSKPAALVAGSITADNINPGSIPLARLGPTDANPNHPAPSEPGSDPTPPTPPDNNGDGQPGGSDALQPYAVLRATVRGVPAGHVVYGPREEIDQLVETGEARLADEADLAIAGVHVRALPSLTPEI